MKTIDFFSETFQTNPWPLYAHFRAFDPIHWSPLNRCFFLFKRKHVYHVLESKDFSVEHPFRASRQVFGPTILDIDGSNHQRLRSLSSSRFKLSNIESYKTSIIEPVVQQLVARIADAGHVDFISDFAVHIPIQVMAKILGIPVEDSWWLYEQLRPIIQYLDNPRSSLEEATFARENLESYLRSIMKQYGSTQENTVLGQLIRAHTLNQTLDNCEIIRNTMLLLAAGTETTVAAIGNTMVCLLAHPKTFNAVQRNHELIPSVVRETFRWQPPLHITTRFAVSDVELEGVLIPQGTPVQLSLASANRDEDWYSHSEVWNPTRVERGILSFGAGKHSCLGFMLAKQEIEIVLKTLFERLVNLEVKDNILPPIQGIVFRSPPSLRIHFKAR